MRCRFLSDLYYDPLVDPKCANPPNSLINGRNSKSVLNGNNCDIFTTLSSHTPKIGTISFKSIIFSSFHNSSNLHSSKDIYRINREAGRPIPTFHDPDKPKKRSKKRPRNSAGSLESEVDSNFLDSIILKNNIEEDSNEVPESEVSREEIELERMEALRNKIHNFSKEIIPLKETDRAISTFVNAIFLAAKAGNILLMEEFDREFTQSEFGPTQDSMNIVLWSYGKYGYIEKLKNYVTKMIGLNLLNLDSIHLMVVGSLQKRCAVDPKAIGMYMEKLAIKPTIDTFILILDSYLLIENNPYENSVSTDNLRKCFSVPPNAKYYERLLENFYFYPEECRKVYTNIEKEYNDGSFPNMTPGIGASVALSYFIDTNFGKAESFWNQFCDKYKLPETDDTIPLIFGLLLIKSEEDNKKAFDILIKYLEDDRSRETLTYRMIKSICKTLSITPPITKEYVNDLLLPWTLKLDLGLAEPEDRLIFTNQIEILRTNFSYKNVTSEIK